MASSWFFSCTVSTMRGHVDIKMRHQFIFLIFRNMGKKVKVSAYVWVFRCMTVYLCRSQFLPKRYDSCLFRSVSNVLTYQYSLLENDGFFFSFFLVKSGFKFRTLRSMKFFSIILKK
jgi:hypothetical protein